MLQAKFSLKYKTALAFGLNNSLQNLKFQTIFAFSSELENKWNLFFGGRNVCVPSWLGWSLLAEHLGGKQQFLCPELPAEGGLCSGNSRDLPSLSWLFFLTWAIPEGIPVEPCSLGMLHSISAGQQRLSVGSAISSETGEKFPAAGAARAGWTFHLFHVTKSLK